jgi:hypothetical protein
VRLRIQAAAAAALEVLEPLLMDQRFSPLAVLAFCQT